MSDSSVGFQITSDPDRTTVGSPQTAGAPEREAERRVRFLLVADLDPQAAAPDWEAGHLVRPIDATTFAGVLREWSPRLDVSVADHLGEAGGHRTVAWAVDALDALTPEGIVRRVPELAAVAAARAAVAEARAGALDLDGLRARLQETGVVGTDALADAVRARPDRPDSAGTGGVEASGDGLDKLLGMVSLDGPSDVPPPPASSGFLDALVGAAVGQEAASGIDAASAERVLADLDARLRAQVVAILDHPDVRRLEAAWRGLKFLVDRLAFRRGARLDVLAAPKGALAEALHFQVLLPEHADGLERAPLGAVVVDHAFAATSADLAALGDLAASGASLQVPVVASVGPAFFGLDTPTDFSRLPPVVSLLDRPEYAAFRSLRGRPDAAFLALALPPFVLRPPYGPDHPDRAHGVEGAQILWGGGALLVAAAMAGRHAETGWPTPPAGTAVAGLPVRKTRMGALPLAAAFGDSVLQDLARAGLLGLSGPLQTDRAVLGPTATTARPDDASPDARAQVSLPAAVFTSIAAHRALTIGPELAGMDEAVALDEIGARFRALLHTGSALPDDAVTVQSLAEHETATSRTFGVRLRPPARVLADAVGLVFGVEVPKDAPSDGR
jgi:type VI secretion system protein ImpC